MPLVTLTTDFGISSPYVAQMKGVLLSLYPETDLVDVTHGIRPQNIVEAAIVLADVTPFFPAGTLHVAVIDPGVGSARRLLYAELREQKYLLPDNGLLTLLAEQHRPRRLISLENRAFWRTEVSSTFHGRDILAPVAAHLCRGTSPADLGPEVREFVRLPWPRAEVSQGRIKGEIIFVDSFGNLITNITRQHFSSLGPYAEVEVRLLGKSIRGISATYAAAPRGSLIALCDSHSRLEVAVVSGSAAKELAAGPGTAVELKGITP